MGLKLTFLELRDRFDVKKNIFRVKIFCRNITFYISWIDGLTKAYIV